MPRRDGSQRLTAVLLEFLPLIFFLGVILVFSQISTNFLTVQTGINILLQSASVAVLAVGESLVLLVGGIDLSIGAAMYVAVVMSIQYTPLHSPLLALLITLIVGVVFGAVNALLIVRLAVTPFIVTLSTLFVGRGIGLFLAGTGPLFPSRPITTLARTSVIGVPVAIGLAAIAILGAALVLGQTPFGRHLYAIGANREGARKAGIRVERATYAVYVICALFAALGGFISLFQIGSASTTFGEGKEFLAISAAVLGGTSLAGGRGGVVGPVLGSILIQTTQRGLVMSGTDPYFFPIVTALIIFLAVVVDTLRTSVRGRLQRRLIRPGSNL